MDEMEKFFRRYKKAKTRSDEWSSILEACYFYAVPFRNRFWEGVEQQGEFKNARVYDSTGVEATKSFVSKMHDTMTPPQVQWGFLTVDAEDNPDIDPEKISDVQKVVAEYMRKVFRYIHKSNFDVAINEAYFDLAVGTSCLVCNSYTDDNPLLFTSIPIDQLSIEESMDGKIHTWFRTWKEVKIGEITYRWKNAQLNFDLQQRVNNNPNAVTRMIEGVSFNPWEKAPFKYVVTEDNSSATPVVVKEMKINPGVIWRFQKTNNEWWGRGPVMQCLPALMRANEMAKIEYASANLNVFKPYMGFSDTVFNPYTFKLRPMSIIPISRVGGGGQVPLIPLPDSSNPAFAQMKIQDLRNQINTLMYADPLGPIDAPVKSATELALRQQGLAEKIGPLFTRLQQEFLWPILQITMETLDSSGILKMPRFEGVEIKFEYNSPLALSKGQQDLAMLTQYIQVMQGIMGPDVTQLIINNKELPYLAADKLQIDRRFLNTQEQVAEVAQQLQQRQQEMQMMQGEQQ